MTADDILAYLRSGTVPEVCICGQVIPDTAIYYGFPLSNDADAPMAFVNEWHDHCLAEWGYVRDNSDFGIIHATTYCGMVPVDPGDYTLGG